MQVQLSQEVSAPFSRGPGAHLRSSTQELRPRPAWAGEKVKEVLARLDCFKNSH